MPMPFEELAAAILQCRMSWPLAERCAADLARAGLPNISQDRAAELLDNHMPNERSLACAEDLRRAGLIEEG